MKTLKIVSVGNSKGIRLPSDILHRQGFSKEVECIETLEGLLLRPKRTGMLSWEDAFIEMGQDAAYAKESREMEGTLSDGLPKEDFSWLSAK